LLGEESSRKVRRLADQTNFLILDGVFHPT